MKLDLIVRFRFVVLSLSLFATMIATAIPPQISPRDLDFDGNHQMRNAAGAFPDPEVSWTSGGSYVAPAISINIDGTLTVKFQHFNDSDKYGTGVFRFYFAELELPGGTVPLLVNGHWDAQSSISIPAYSTFWSDEFTISGWDPWVQQGRLRFGYLVDTTGIAGLIGFGMTREIEFLVNLNAPVDSMVPVWHELLRQSCAYADGDENAAEVAHDLTLGLYNAGRFEYTDAAGFPSQFTAPDIEFDLPAYIEAEGVVEGNCIDLATFLSMLFDSQGLGNTITERVCVNGQFGAYFVSNYVCPVGKDSTNYANYGQIAWTSHWVVKHEGAIYDSCLALWLDPNQSSYKMPPSAWDPPDHWYTSHGTTFTGVAMRYLQESEILTIPYEHGQPIINTSYPHEQTDVEDYSHSITELEP